MKSAFQTEAPGAHELILRRMRSLAPVGAELEAQVRALDVGHRHGAGIELSREREPVTPRFLVAGWAAQLRWLPDGRRQIINFILPGDGLGLYERPHPLSPSAVVALTPVRTLHAGPFVEALMSRTGPTELSNVCHLIASMHEAMLLDQIIRLGRQTAFERLVHLMLELNHRHRLIGLSDGRNFACPLTQEMLADATGLSLVHVNRTLQQLRRDDLLDLRSGVARLLQPDQLAVIGDWRPPAPSRDLASAPVQVPVAP